MGKKRFLSVAAAMGLVLSLFIGAVGTTSAQTAGQGKALALYLPWVHNGDELDGAGPWFGTVTVQNVEDYAVNATIKTAGGTATSFLLNPHAQKTFSAAQLGVAEGGEGVTIGADWTNVKALAENGSGVCIEGNTVSVTKGAEDAVDTVTDAHGSSDYPIVEVTRVWAGTNGSETEFTADTDYTADGDTVGPDVDSPDGETTISIDWSLDGAEPEEDASYNVEYVLCRRLPWIGAVEKHMMPELFNSAQTSSAQTAVDGYTALSVFDLPWDNDSGASSELGLPGFYQSFLPIVQTNSGWNSVIHVTNFGADNAAATITFYGAGSQGAAGPSFGPFTQTLLKGETWTLDAKAIGIPEGWVGTAFISSDDRQVVTQVDRVKPETSMALTNTAAPYYGGGDWGWTLYAPLVFKDYNGWNTGINITNLEDHDNTIQITYYGQNGNVVDQEQITIPRRGMEFVYRPNVGDIGLGPSSITSAVLTSNEGAFHAAVDEVKYTGKASEGAGHAMSYLATAQGASGVNFTDDGFDPGILSLALFQKGFMNGAGDTSGINLFNASSQFSVTGHITFFDSSGAPVAPTLNKSLDLTLSAFQSATVYSINYSEMPQGFQGSALVETDGAGELVGVSNNVNYAVDGDGSTVFNLLSTCGNFNWGCGGITDVIRNGGAS